MIRKIIKINEEKCNGCGACASACHEGAIGMVDGKAKLLREDYCDGLGDCLPTCPVDASPLKNVRRLLIRKRQCLRQKQKNHQKYFLVAVPEHSQNLLKGRELILFLKIHNLSVVFPNGRYK